MKDERLELLRNLVLECETFNRKIDKLDEQIKILSGEQTIHSIVCDYQIHVNIDVSIEEKIRKYIIDILYNERYETECMIKDTLNVVYGIDNACKKVSK